MTDPVTSPADTSAADAKHVEAAIIGGGQAGLAVGSFLARQRRQFTIFEASSGVAEAWRRRWDSLVLFTPRRYSALPGLPFPGDQDGYPTRDEVVAYLEDYAARFALPLELNSEVRSARFDGEVFVLDVAGRTVTADQVVVATGPFHVPKLPEAAGTLDGDVFQIHSADYRRPAEVPPGSVVVVGGGNTGYQIAKELAATHTVSLAVGSRQTPLPQRLLGRDIFWWLTRLGLLEKTVDSRLGRRAQGRDTLIGSSPRELRRRHRVELRSRVVEASGRAITFADGTTVEPEAVIWATGYRPDHAWLQLPVFDGDGRIAHRRGVTDVRGLFFVGLSWQHTRGSALIGWVQDDAAFIAAQVAAVADGQPVAVAPAREDNEAPEPAGLPEGV